MVTLRDTDKVIFDEPPPGAAIEAGLKLTFMPLGAPAADKAIGAEKPPDTLTVRVTELLLPSVRTPDGDGAESAKFALVVVVVVVSALINPFPLGLPHPVTRS